MTTRWSFGVVLQVLLLFLLAAACEIGGGWLVWQALRERKPAWWALLGSLLLVLYGFCVTLQPIQEFGRLYAVYGGLFIACSLLWARVLDGFRPDLGDAIGASLCMVGAAVMLFWPRAALELQALPQAEAQL